MRKDVDAHAKALGEPRGSAAAAEFLKPRLRRRPRLRLQHPEGPEAARRRSPAGCWQGREAMEGECGGSGRPQRSPWPAADGRAMHPDRRLADSGPASHARPLQGEAATAATASAPGPAQAAAGSSPTPAVQRPS
mmetsp:Transcript_83666/g.260184  ORF Transcript_83666/g.260184 Transcript_83666/m.260184 type:complete len:135 (+) Transcript_83666:17-421(+)